MYSSKRLLQELGIQKTSFYKYLKACKIKPSGEYTEEQFMVLKQYQAGLKKNPPVRRFKLLLLDESNGQWYVKRIIPLNKSRQVLKEYVSKGHICRLKEMSNDKRTKNH